MEPLVITLNFDKTHPSGLAGNEEGQKVFSDQMQSHLDNYDGSRKIRIVFPSYVERIAISFIQGLTVELANRFGRAALAGIVEFDTSDSELTAKITKDMLA